MRKIFLLVLILFSTSFSRSLDEIQKEGVIIVAVYNNFPPYSYMKNGLVKGIDVDIAKKVAQNIGVKVKWYFTGSDENLGDDLRNVIWKGHLIHKTKADVMFRVPYDYDYIRETDKATGELNNELVVMKSPYQTERWIIVTNKKIIPEIPSLAIFKYHQIAVELDTLPDSYLGSSFRGILQNNIKHYRNIKDALKDLENGKINAVAALKSQAEFFLNFSENKDKYFISKGIGYAKSKWDLGVAVRTDFRALSYEIDGQIEKLYKTGEIKKIFNKYGVSYEKPLVYQDNN